MRAWKRPRRTGPKPRGFGAGSRRSRPAWTPKPTRRRGELDRLRTALQTALEASDELRAERDRLREETTSSPNRSARSGRELESLGEAHRVAEDGHRTEVDRLRAECETFSDKLDELLTELSTEQAGREAIEEELSEVRADLEAERGARVEERAQSADAARLREEEHGREITGWSEQLREAEARAEAAAVEGDRRDPDWIRLQAELASKSAEVVELRAAVQQAQMFKAKIGTFLSGLGIRLPS